MQIAIAIANEDAAGRNYLTWTPVQGTVRQLEVDPEFRSSWSRGSRNRGVDLGKRW